jgi:3-methyladenine DNA glycosylase/8-oxoguanine DNA glycosylase
MMTAMVFSRAFRPARPVDLGLTLGPLARGRIDPTMRFAADGVWRATRTPLGAATTRITPRGAEIEVTAWGPGAEWALDAAPSLLGGDDDDSAFVAHHPLIADAHRRFPGLRIARSQAVLEALVPTVLEQKVVGKAAKRSWAGLVRRYSEPAPGPLGKALWLPPDPARLAGLSAGAFHRLNVERKRADAIRLSCTHAARLEQASTFTATDARARLTALPGLGDWTYAQVALVALGDADAIPVGDYHLKNYVSWNLSGRPRGTDDEMVELLEPYRGQRGRALRLLILGGDAPPRYGPRLEIQSIAAI